MRPKQLARKPYGMSVDVWAYGCCLVCLYHNVQSPYQVQLGSAGVISRAMEPQSGFLIRVAEGALRPTLSEKASAPKAIVALVEACCQYAMDARPAAHTLIDLGMLKR